MGSRPSDNQNEPDNSDQSIARVGASPFQTTIEVISGVKLLYNITRALITNLAANRIDTHAFTVCLKIGSALDWSPQGRDRFHDAMKDLGLVPAWDKMLKFGFNWKGPVSEILALDDGERFAALTACLSEIYTPNVVAQTYIELLKLFVEKNPNDVHLQNLFIPSLLPMRSVVERFAGIFSTSSFATSVEDYMSIDEHAVVTGGTQNRKINMFRSPTSRTISSPVFIADALYELLQLSRDGSKTQQIQFFGGADGIAMAAIGRFLIDLPTEIYKEVGGSMENVTIPELKADGKPRVIVIFSEENPQKSKIPQLTKSRVVCLPQMNDIIKGNRLSDPEPVIAGRCCWNKVLSTTFRGSFNTLTQGLYTQFASALGCAAGIFQALAQGDESLPQKWLVACRTYSDSSFGPDYISFALQRFPELQKSLKRMEPMMQDKARLPYAEAVEQLEEALSKISMECRCKVCWSDGQPNPRGQTRTSRDGMKSKEWYCLTTLATTIIRLIRVLSGIDLVNDELCLKREGVEWFYNQQRSRHQRQRQMAKTHTNTRDELYVTRILDYVRVDKTAPEFSSLAVAITLYSGVQRQEDLPSYTSAIQCRGICAYLRILDEPSCDARRVARICVIPGCIEYRGSPYGGIQDLGFNPFQDTQHFVKTDVRPDHCVPERTKNLATKCTSRTSKDLKLCFSEQLGNFILPMLEIGFSVSGTEEPVLEWLGPARAVENITRGTGLTMCDPSRCSQTDMVEEELKKIIPLGFPTASPFEIFSSQDVHASIFRGDTPTALIAACGCWLPVFLTESNCVKCAIHTGIKNSWKNFAIVCSEMPSLQVSIEIFICCTLTASVRTDNPVPVLGAAYAIASPGYRSMRCLNKSRSALHASNFQYLLFNRVDQP